LFFQIYNIAAVNVQQVESRDGRKRRRESEYLRWKVSRWDVCYPGLSTTWLRR